MYRPLSLYLGWRLTRSRKPQRFIGFIATISMFGIALGVCSLITVLSVMNGFENELKQRFLRLTDPLLVSLRQGPWNDWQALAETLAQEDEIHSVQPLIKGDLLISQQRHDLVEAIGLLQPTPALQQSIKRGSAGLVAGKFQLLIGAELAQYLDLYVGDKTTLTAPLAQITPAGILPRSRRFTVSGIYQSGTPLYDRYKIYTALQDAAALLAIKPAIHSLRLVPHDAFDTPRLRTQLATQLGEKYQVSDWSETHRHLFSAIANEKRMMFLLLLLIVAVAAFNLVAALVMQVREQRSNIALLQTIGLPPSAIVRIFLVQGLGISLSGTILGVVGGVLLSYQLPHVVATIEGLLSIDFLPADLYYISDLPVLLRYSDLWQVAIAALALSLATTLYPCWRASRTDPAVLLRDA